MNWPVKNYLTLFTIILPTRPFLITFTLCCLIHTAGIGQYHITGVVKDADGNPLANANVLLLNANDSSLVKGSITSETGFYSFENKQKGQFLIASSFMGLGQVYSPVFTINQTNENIQIGILSFGEKKDKALETVAVTAKKPLFEQKIDRMIINVKSSITSAGSTALNILERSPGVIVNRQNNNLSMNGKDGVVIMINGKVNRLPLESVVQMLAGMSSGNIERIELISTPPANFDAEGNAGFINIVMVTNTDVGTNGAYSVSAGYGKGETSEANINFNTRKGKFNLYGDYSFSRLHQKQYISLYRIIDYHGKLTETFFNSRRHPVTPDHNARLGLDYQLSKKTMIGSQVSLYDDIYSTKGKNDESIYVDHLLDTIINIAHDEVTHWRHLSGNVNVQHTFAPEEKLTIDADYLHYRNTDPNNYDNSFLDGSGNELFNEKTRSMKNTPIDVWVASVDYTKRIARNVTIESGAKSSVSKFTNDISLEKFLNNEWKLIPEFSANYKLKEDITALYSALNISMNEKTNMKLGLRYEYITSNLGTATEKNIVDRKYGEFFPGFFVSHKIDSFNTINLSLTRRITRPTFNQLAPFLFFFDPNSFIQGNPALQPSISSTVKTDYLFKRFTLSLSLSHEKNSIIKFQETVDPVTNKQILTGGNLKSLNVAATTLTLPITVINWWTMQNNVIATYQQVKTSYNGAPVELAKFDYRLTVTQNFKLPKQFSIEVSGMYQSPSIYGRSQQSSFGEVSVGAQKNIGDKKGSLRLNVIDIFHTMIFKFTNNIPDQNLNAGGTLNYLPRTVSLTYTRNFGNDKLKEKRIVTGAEEERSRVEK